jgi:hypothetical protein
MDLEVQSIERKILPGALGCYGIGFVQKGMLHPVGEKESHQPHVRPHINQRSSMNMRSQEENVTRVGNARVHHRRRYVAVRICLESHTVEQAYQHGPAHDSLPDLPPKASQ